MSATAPLTSNSVRLGYEPVTANPFAFAKAMFWRQVMMIIAACRIIKLLKQVGKSLPVAQWQGNGHIQTICAGKSASWLQV